MTSDVLREDELPDECPFPCDLCPDPGDCEDCLDCLLWPEKVVDPPISPWAPRVRTSPVRTHELQDIRQRIDVGRRVGLVLRRVRRHGHLSQAALADRVGWPTSSLSRAEHDASSMSLGRIDTLLRQVGHRLAIVADGDSPAASAAGELPDEAWGTAELLARDRRGRRFPPFAQLTWEDPLERDLHGRHGQPLPEWTWTWPGSKTS